MVPDTREPETKALLLVTCASKDQALPKMHLWALVTPREMTEGSATADLVQRRGNSPDDVTA